jgi:hypothetical protein
MKNTLLSQPNATTSGPGAETYPLARSSGDRALVSDIETPFRETQFGWVVLATVWIGAGLYLGANLHRGWCPMDAGTLAQTAERILHGQVPYRDFGELYTGGLGYLNALAFRLLGVNLFSLRIPLFLSFLAWVPAVYFIARRFSGPMTAGAITLLAVAWSVPEYPEAMPSWYNLFFATWGTLALLRYTEGGRRRWLGAAGLCAGLSFLVKISGLFFAGAVLLFFIFREQSIQPEWEFGASRTRGMTYRLFITASLLGFVVSLISAASAVPAASEFVHFVLPGGCLAAYLLWMTWRDGSHGSGRRLARLLGVGLPFLGGALLPTGFYLTWLAQQGAVAVWFRGTFFRPFVRTLWAGGPPNPLVISIGLVPIVLVVLLAFDSHPSSRRLARLAVPLALGGLLVGAWKSYSIYAALGYSLPLVVPLAALATPICLRRISGISERRRQQVFLMASVGVLCALIQYPAPVPIYFSYAVPLVILALLGLFSTRTGFDLVAIGSLLAFYLIFAVWLHTPGYFFELRERADQAISFETLNLARASHIRGKASEVEEYEDLIRVVQAHARGRYIYATPDCPEIYFLSGFRNPTGALFGFLRPDFPDPVLHTERVLQAVDEHAVNLVVIGPPLYEPPMPPGLRTGLDARFPHSLMVHGFDVRWK